MRNSIVLVLLIITTLLAASFAFSASVRIVTTEGIDTWLVAAVPNTGDAVGSGHKTDWLEENIGITEEDFSVPANGPKEGDKIIADARFAWKEVNSAGATDNSIDFQRGDIFGENDNITAYMYLYITSDQNRKANIWVGSDDTIKVWLNGELMHDNPALRGWAPNQDQIKNAQFKKGKNGLLIKVCEQGGGWAGWCRIDPVEGLKASTDKKKDGNPIPAPKKSNFYIIQFFSLIGPNPQADAAVSANSTDLIDLWTGGKYNEDDIALGIGIDDKFSLKEETAEGWELCEFSDSGGDNIQVLVRDYFNRQADQNNITWYGYTVITSPDKRDVDLKAGSDDTIKIWLNGEVVHDNPVLRGASGFLDTIPMTLEKGNNSLLVKVCEQGGGWAAFVGFDDSSAYDGLEVDATREIRFAVNPTGKLPTKWGEIKVAR